MIAQPISCAGVMASYCGMKQIPLTNGGFTTVDDEDFERLSRYRWQRDTTKPRVFRCEYVGSYKSRTIYMHREIVEAPQGMSVDHIDGNTLNNERHNLRICTHAQNMKNIRRKQPHTSRFKGVYFESATGRWRAQIGSDNKSRVLGRFATEVAAARAYDAAAGQLHGDYACTNETLGLL
jgi:hypothetical protein